MKRLLTFFPAWILALCSWAQSAQDFAARFMESCSDNEEVKCVTMLKANRKRYSLYRPKDNTDYGDCLWVRKVKDKIVELVYVAPHSEKTFMVMNFTGKISDGFVERIIKPEENREQKKTTN